MLLLLIRRMDVCCKHYWICGQPSNGYVEARCCQCGEIARWETQSSKEAKREKARHNAFQLDKEWETDAVEV